MRSFDKFFDKIYIINLESMPDRRDLMINELSKYGIKNYEFFNACRPEVITDYPVSYHSGFNKKLVNRNENYAKGALGCKLSHYNIIKKASTLGLKKILILEDDCRFDKNALKYYWKDIAKQINQQLPNWHMLYLSANMHSDPEMLTKYVSKALNAYTTHSYALNLSDKNFVNDILENMLSSGLEIDSYYAKKVQAECLYNIYIAIPSLSYQATGYSNIRSGVKDYKPKLLRHGQAMNKSLLYKTLRILRKNLKLLSPNRVYLSLKNLVYKFF